jgi:sporulation protein YlmC with PRC-barrel domain
MPADPGTGLHQNTYTAAGVNKYVTRLELSMYRASVVIGREVNSSDNENAGEVDDLMIDRTGHLRAIVVAVGDILGLGERNIAVPMDRLRFGSNADGTTSQGPGTTGTIAAPPVSNPATLTAPFTPIASANNTVLYHPLLPPQRQQHQMSPSPSRQPSMGKTAFGRQARLSSS